MKILSPSLPLSKWEPPPYQQRDSPTDAGETVRRPSRMIGDYTANHFDARNADPPEAGKQASHSHHPRVSIVDSTGVVVRPSLEMNAGTVRRQPPVDEPPRPSRKAAVPRRQDRPPRRPPTDTDLPTSPQPLTQDCVSVPIICNYVDPAPINRDELPPQSDVEQHHRGQLLVPPSTSAARTATSTTPIAVSTPAGIEISAAVANEVREVKKMLRSFMAKLSQRDLRERNAFEWRIVALALDRLFFIIYLALIKLALVYVFVQTANAK